MRRRTLNTRLPFCALTVLVTVLALIPAPMNAQTPGPYPGLCSSPSTPQLPPPLTGAQLQQWQAQFAQDLSQSLNAPLPAVQQAITGLSSANSPQQPITAPPDPVMAAAAQLDVSFDSLLSAVQTADQAIFCSAPSAAAPTTIGAVSPGGGPGQGPIDPTAFFATVAQDLGQGTTQQTVESAFVAAEPPAPDPSAPIADLQNQFDQLAGSLGVSTDALKNALTSMGSSGGCLPPNTLGGLHAPMGTAPAPAPAAMRPLIIPLLDVTPPRLPGTPDDPLGLGLPPCGLDMGPPGTQGRSS